MRLLGGDVVHEGRVEVYRRHRWGTVCNDTWNLKSAMVVCRQLGYDGVSNFRSNARYGRGWLHQNFIINCTGLEKSIRQCWSLPSQGVKDCRNGKEAGVRCCKCLCYKNLNNEFN